MSRILFLSTFFAIAAATATDGIGAHYISTNVVPAAEVTSFAVLGVSSHSGSSSYASGEMSSGETSSYGLGEQCGGESCGEGSSSSYDVGYAIQGYGKEYNGGYSSSSKGYDGHETSHESSSVYCYGSSSIAEAYGSGTSFYSHARRN